MLSKCSLSPDLANWKKKKKTHYFPERSKGMFLWKLLHFAHAEIPFPLSKWNKRVYMNGTYCTSGKTDNNSILGISFLDPGWKDTEAFCFFLPPFSVPYSSLEKSEFRNL